LSKDILFADDNARLGPAQKLVAAERHNIHVGGEHFPHGRLMLQAISVKINQAAAAQIVENGNIVLFAQGYQRQKFGLFGKADDPVIAGVHF